MVGTAAARPQSKSRRVIIPPPMRERARFKARTGPPHLKSVLVARRAGAVHRAIPGARAIARRVRYTPTGPAPRRHHASRITDWIPNMDNVKGPNIKKRPKCKNCEGKGLLKKGDKVVKCQRCGG